MANKIPQVPKVVTGIAVLDRWINQLLDVLNPWLQIGTNRIQGGDVPQPTDGDDGKALRWSAKQKKWVLDP